LFATSTHAAVAAANGPRIQATHSKNATGWASSNWSGYAITGGPFTSVTGSWVVPTVAKTRHATYSSSWAGIDGFSNSNLIQAGTEQDYYSGAAHYFAWWEILPAAETRISLSVKPGDQMSVSITRGSNGWTITVKDARSGSFTTVQSYSGPGTSAEWIQEAPSVGGHIATLAKYGHATFDPGTANGKSPALVSSDGGVMVQKSVQVSTPSVPDRDFDGFNVKYGSTAPAALSS
ncbi:MAG TPA: G1 family glutamic endopeptidase, partial [Acidimicrobiales bacterium]|nr:G1 family glutamic endopeptidase [Acidimicrobiales bacterium]